MKEKESDKSLNEKKTVKVTSHIKAKLEKLLRNRNTLN